MSLEALFTKSNTVEFKGVEIVINDVCMDDLPLITKIVGGFITGEGDTASKVSKLVSENFPDVKKLISSLTTIKSNEVGKLSLDAVVFIVSKIIEFNIVFLKKSVVPLAQSLTNELNKTGLDQSNS